MSKKTKERMAEIAAELIKRFEAAGFEPTEYKHDFGSGEFSVNHKAIVIDEKQTVMAFAMLEPANCSLSSPALTTK